MTLLAWRRGVRRGLDGWPLLLLAWYGLFGVSVPAAAAREATRAVRGAVVIPAKASPLIIFARGPRRGGTLPSGGGGGGSFPYGAASLPTGMSWDWTEGGTRQVTGSPLSFSYSSVPTVTGTVYDVTSAATWATAVASAVDGDGIRITADFAITTPLMLTRTTSSGGWVLVYTDRKATLDSAVPYSANYMSCTSTNRIDPTDTTAFRTITTSGTGGNTPVLRCAQSAVGYWIVGLNVTCTANGNEALIDIYGQTQTQASHFPSRIVIDRCVVAGAEKAKRGINADGNGMVISGCHIAGITSTPQGFTDSVGIWAGRGGQNLLIFNNAVAAESECIIFGGGQAAYNPFNPGTDSAVIRNLLFKPSAWDSDASYNLKKNMFELKTGVRVLFFGNVLQRYRSSSGGQFYQYTMTPTNQAGTDSWAAISDVNIVGNYSIDANEGGIWTLNPQGSSSNANNGGARLTFVHNYHPHGSDDGQSKFVFSCGTGTQQKHWNDLHIEHNTLPCKETWFTLDNSLLGVGQWQRFVCRNNANWKAPNFGPIFSSGGVNKAQLDSAFGAGNWTFANNAQVSGGASWGTTSSLLVAPYNCIEGAVGTYFTNPAGADYSAKASGPLDGTATDGLMIGADAPWVSGTLTAGVQ